jgi:ribosome-binding factor A
MESHRFERVGEALRQELTELIAFELDDPRLSSVDVTNIIVSPGGRSASVQIHVPGDQVSQRRALSALSHASSYLRSRLALRLQLRRIPELHFAIDTHPDSESRVDILLKRAKKLKSFGENAPK